jgi:hypothetical protein
LQVVKNLAWIEKLEHHLHLHYIASMTIVQATVAIVPICLMGIHKENQHHVTSQVPQETNNFFYEPSLKDRFPASTNEGDLPGASEQEMPTVRLIDTVNRPNKIRFKGWLCWYA